MDASKKERLLLICAGNIYMLKVLSFGQEWAEIANIMLVLAEFSRRATRAQKLKLP